MAVGSAKGSDCERFCAGGDSMNYPVMIIAILVVTVAAFVWVEYGKPLLTMLGLQSDERE
jgi:hypothetical protein